MARLTFALVGLAGILAGALGYSVLNRPEPGMDAAEIRAIIEDVLSAREAELAAMAAPPPAEPLPVETAEIDPSVINPMIEDYLMSDPTILQRLSAALDTQIRTVEREAAATAIASMREVIFNDPGQVVLGNPQGDVTLVEMFDYNCGYCRSALPDLATLIAEDPNLRVVLKEFPILSNESIDAARIGVLVSKSDVDYWAFHEALFTSRGQVNKETALAAAADLGLSRVSLELQMGEDEVSKAIQTSYDIAQALNITGTPSYIIGNEIVPGAIGVDELRQRIENMRACGQTECDD